LCVMRGLGPRIHEFFLFVKNTWMPGTSPAMTTRRGGVKILPAVLAVLFMAALAACSHSRATRPAQPAAQQAAPKESAEQIGLAAWIGSFHVGQRTASGETYDPDALTASHRTLPLGSFAWVTNLANNRHVKIRINDRGPRDESRIIELSRAAAQGLGFSSPYDEMKVKVEPIARD